MSVGRLLETSTSHPLMTLGAAVLCLSVIYTLVSIIYESCDQEFLLLTTVSIFRCRRAVVMALSQALSGRKSSPRILSESIRCMTWTGRPLSLPSTDPSSPFTTSPWVSLMTSLVLLIRPLPVSNQSLYTPNAATNETQYQHSKQTRLQSSSQSTQTTSPESPSAAKSSPSTAPSSTAASPPVSQPSTSSTNSSSKTISQLASQPCSSSEIKAGNLKIS